MLICDGAPVPPQGVGTFLMHVNKSPSIHILPHPSFCPPSTATQTLISVCGFSTICSVKSRCGASSVNLTKKFSQFSPSMTIVSTALTYKEASSPSVTRIRRTGFEDMSVSWLFHCGRRRNLFWFWSVRIREGWKERDQCAIIPILEMLLQIGNCFML